ncbi:MAG: TraB/GumN family protein [bacterium]|nr:TraB/GumN family protein [bacterium]
MQKMLAQCVFAIIVFCHLPLHADTSVWVATSADRTVYLGGTIHMLRHSDFPLPVEFNKAYQNAEIIIFETDIGKMNDPSVQQLVLAHMMYSDGRSLQKVLSPETYATLKAHCEKIGVPISSLHPFKPAMAILMLFSLELQRMGVAQAGVDAHFYQKAIADGKSIMELEPLEAQLAFLASMGEGNEDNFVIHAIKDFKRTRELIEQLIVAWREGKVSAFEQLFLADMKRDYPVLHRKLLVERNQNWLPLIESYFETPETEFVLVGAAHLVGEQGILKQLAKRGYTINKLR